MEEEFKTKWDLKRYFYSDLEDENLKKDWDEIEVLVERFRKDFKGKIKNFSANDFLEFFKRDDEIRLRSEKIAFYLNYLFALETQNQEVLKKLGEFENYMMQQSNKLVFISQEFKEIGFEKLMEFSCDELLADYKNYFVQKANNIKYVLDERTEIALNLKDLAGEIAFNNLYEELTNSFMFKINIDGEVKEVTDSEIRTYRTNPDEEIRRRAYASLREVYNDKKVQITLGNTYGAIVKDCISEIKIRGYDNVMSARNISEQLDDEVVLMLLDEVEKAYPLYMRYLKVKAKLLGKEKLMVWDLLAPISNVEKEFDFEKSLKIYLDVISKFDRQFYDYSVDMFKGGRVDVFPKKGKRGGAFASFSQGFESFVLLNHTNKLRDVSTLAHELGHAIHGHLRQKQKSKVYSPGLSLEETASIFNELLLSETLMKSLSDDEKLDFIEKKLEDIFATIFRQVQYVLFEKRVHEAFLSGKELTYVDFNKIWREEQVKMCGDLVEFDVREDEESSWSMIPHIFRSPFYCYSYAFGNILSFALYEKYKEKGGEFVQDYKKILASGGSKKPYDLLIEFGIDIGSREFYRSGLKVIEDLVGELEKLADLN